ncbi:helix-turn-helix transcriptional regulator [Halobacteriovorax sp. HLS]|uniref:helix-turn-helix domain-containing protein n=1 Tax=Halobacteriovorax sp. HLS TaxID=2234000 RepID=UPI000FD72F34|nr:helix-turn-helix transcriptional regulator [Halobacteriovorax sp. HLS]
MDAMTYTSDLCADLSKRVREYKKSHPALSSTQVAKRFNMSTSSLNRIENCDVRMPAIDQIIKILRGTGAKGDLLKYLDEHYPIIAETYREAYSSKTNEYIDIDLEYYLNDKDKFIIILLALSGNGTTREEISREFGQQGLLELDFLVDKNLLLEKDGRIGHNDQLFHTSASTLKSLLANTVEKSFKSDQLNDDQNFISYYALRANREKVSRKIIGILKEAEMQILDVLNDPLNEGEDDIFFGLVTDSLISRNVTSSKGVIQ